GDLASGVPEGVKFRTIDSDAWTGGNEVFVDQKTSLEYGTYAYALSPGQNGYLAVWERDYFPDASAEPRIAVLDTQGNIVIGPLRRSAPRRYPGRAANGVWSGSSSLVTTSFADCLSGESLCTSRSVVVMRVDPSSNGLEARSLVPALDPATAPRKALLA